MSFGSAAALRVPPEQAPLSPAQTAGSGSPFTALPQPLGASPPIRHLPLLAGADLPPRGRILVIEDDPATALEMQRLLRRAGYRVIGPAGSTIEARELIERIPIQRPIDCALLNARIGDAADIADTLRRRCIPIAWVVSRDASKAAAPIGPDGPVVRTPVDREALLGAIERALGQVSKPHLYATEPPQEVWPRVFPQL